MTTRILEKADWKSYFERLALSSESRQTRIEIIGKVIGDQTLVRSVPMLGLTYEPETDVLEISLDGMDHMIRHPKKITIEERNGALETMEIIDAEGQQQILTIFPGLRM